MLVLLPTQAKRNRGPSLSRVVHKDGHKHVEFPGVCGPPEGTGYLVSRSYSRLALRREFGVNGMGFIHMPTVIAISLFQHTQGTQ